MVTPLLGGPAPRRHARPNEMVNTFTRLAYMTPRERTQKRTHSGGGHHRMSQHPARRTRPQQIHMIDMGTTRQHCRHHRQHLTTRIRSTHPTPQPHHPIYQILQPQPIHQRPRHQQTRVGYQPLIVENHPIPVDIVRYSTHRKCLQTPGQSPLLSMAIVPDQRHFPRLSTHQPPHPYRWIQAKTATV